MGAHARSTEKSWLQAIHAHTPHAPPHAPHAPQRVRFAPHLRGPLRLPRAAARALRLLHRRPQRVAQPGHAGPQALALQVRLRHLTLQLCCPGALLLRRPRGPLALLLRRLRRGPPLARLRLSVLRLLARGEQGRVVRRVALAPALRQLLLLRVDAAPQPVQGACACACACARAGQRAPFEAYMHVSAVRATARAPARSPASSSLAYLRIIQLLQPLQARAQAFVLCRQGRGACAACAAQHAGWALKCRVGLGRTTARDGAPSMQRRIATRKRLGIQPPLFHPHPLSPSLPLSLSSCSWGLAQCS